MNHWLAGKRAQSNLPTSNWKSINHSRPVTLQPPQPHPWDSLTLDGAQDPESQDVASGTARKTARTGSSQVLHLSGFQWSHVRFWIALTIKQQESQNDQPQEINNSLFNKQECNGCFTLPQVTPQLEYFGGGRFPHLWRDRCHGPQALQAQAPQAKIMERPPNKKGYLMSSTPFVHQ